MKCRKLTKSKKKSYSVQIHEIKCKKLKDLFLEVSSDKFAYIFSCWDSRKYFGEICFFKAVLGSNKVKPKCRRKYILKAEIQLLFFLKISGDEYQIV
jgi:hypothetical protein